MTFSHRLDRGSIRFAFPIALCPMSTSNATTMVWAVVSPFLISAIVNQIVRPKQKLRREKAMQHAAQQRLSYLTDARKTALMQQELMKTIAAEHTQQEREKETGLIILVARYGKNPSKCPIRHAEQSEDGQAVHAINLDVTIPLQFFILVRPFFYTSTLPPTHVNCLEFTSRTTSWAKTRSPGVL